MRWCRAIGLFPVLLWLCSATLLNGQGWAMQHLESLEYPALAAAARAQGEIVVRCHISGDGLVSSTEVLSDTSRSTGLTLLARAAEENARRWRFRRSNGTKRRADGSRVAVTYRFHLAGECHDGRCQTTFWFDFPNLITVIGQFRPLSAATAAH